MTTTTDSLFDTALRAAAQVGRTRYPGETVRIDKGLVLALNGHVTLEYDGTARVTSAKDPEIAYRVKDGVCDCPDASRAPDARCKHRIAASLVRYVQTQQHIEGAREPETLEPAAVAPSTELPEGQEPLPLAQDPAMEAPDDAPPFLPEAGASLNIELKFGSGKVMYTARGHSDAEVLARLPGIIAGIEKALASSDEEAGFFTRLSYAFWPRKRQTTPSE